MSDTSLQQADQSVHALHAASGRSNDSSQGSTPSSQSASHLAGGQSATQNHQHHHNEAEEGNDDDDDDDDENETFETDEGEVFEEDTDDQAEPMDDDDDDDDEEEEDGAEEDNDNDDDEQDDDEEEIVLIVDENTGLRRAASLTRSDPRHPDSAMVARSSSPLARRLRRQHIRMTTPRTTNMLAQGARGRSTAVASGSALQGSGDSPLGTSASSSASSSSSSTAGATAGSQGTRGHSSGSANGTGTSQGSSAVSSSSAPAPIPASVTARPVTVPVIDEKAQSELRRKIMDIQRDPTISFAEKAAMIQRLMSSKWQEAKKQESEKDSEGKDGALEASEADLKTTYANEENQIMGCKHYSRGCKLKANCCGKWFNCRFCHDDACDHAIVRTETKYMLCMHCKSIQLAAQDCKDCHKRLARYYCNVCKLWDDDPKKTIYHCEDCGICRIGRGLGQDYFHCKKCNVCMAISLQNNHKCIERNLECDCPICGEYMFTSTSTVMFMPCGHCIHYKCHDAYIRTSYQCPTCWKALADMSEYYAKVDQLMAQQPMPPEYASYYSIVLCNDCEVKTETAFHFLYHKCGQCKGYNTKVLQTFQRVGDGQDKVVVENAGEGASSGSASSQQNNSQRGLGSGSENVDGGGNSAGPSSMNDAGGAGSSSAAVAAAAALTSALGTTSGTGGASPSGARLPGIPRAGSPGSLETNNDDGGDGMSGRGNSNTYRAQ